MPLRSEAQRRWAHANKPEMAERWEKKTSGDLPERVGKMTEAAFGRMYGRATNEQKKMMHAAVFVADRRSKAKLANTTFTAKSVDAVADILQQPLMKAGPLPQLETLSKGCDCDHDARMMGRCGHGNSLPMTGKADEMLEEVPWAVKQLMSQMPLEIQATELGGAGSTDIRPAMDQMNYENPARNAGECSGCDHVRAAPGVLMCSALAGDPAVGPKARCDLWVGGVHKSQDHLIHPRGLLKKSGGISIPRGAEGLYFMANSQSKDGNVKTYQEQTLPDYQYVYGNDAKLQSRQEREASIRRRISMSFKHTAKYGFHGNPPEPTLRYEKDETVQWAPRKPKKVANKEPVVVGPIIDDRGTPLRSRSFLAPRLTMAGKSHSPEHTDGQDGRAQEELMFFMDREGAEKYALAHGLKAVSVDEALAKLYGVMVGGYVVEHPDTRMFLVAS